MRELKTIRFGELIFICSIFIIYTTRRLFEESWRIERLIIQLKDNKISSHVIWRDLENYNHFLNAMLPIILPALLYLIAWYIFHYIIYPTIKAKDFGYMELIYVCSVVFLIAGGAFIYHYFKLVTLFRMDNYGPIGLKFYPIYRKLRIFSTFIAICTVIGLYEMGAQLYYYLYSKLVEGSERSLRYIGYFLLASVALLFLLFALNGEFDHVAWLGKRGDFLFIGAVILQCYVLQLFFTDYILPSLQNPGRIDFFGYVIVYFFICLAGSFIISRARGGYYSFIRIRIWELFFIMLFISIIWAYLARIFSAEKTFLQALISRKSAELSTLQAQINPHFLFNALNSLYATALREGGEKTAEGIQKLGDMMRFMLHENNRDRILLTKEIEYLHNYIEIQRMRIDESHNIEIRVNIQEPDKEIYIAPMMLNPFVENAFKHGISFRNRSWIYITLTLDATSIYFKVHNSIHPNHTIDLEEDKSGVGLDNVKKRLELIYSNRHKLEIQKSDQDYFISLTLGYW